MTQLALHLSTVKRDWVESAKPVILAYAETHGVFTSDDTRALLPEPEQPNWTGIAYAALSSAGRIERDGYQPSTRPEANGRVIARWKVKR